MTGVSESSQQSSSLKDEGYITAHSTLSKAEHNINALPAIVTFNIKHKRTKITKNKLSIN
ncbi:hypothetical protein KZ793_06490 [Photorhabdus sp. UCH-936]|uniref:hypothetical protein n=1 Tax=Photorhabdus antumapuensis TaxID=2862867 RepID=UPI0030DCD3B0|nr:hypothetical protein [Photorhabdus antumapuensis]